MVTPEVWVLMCRWEKLSTTAVGLRCFFPFCLCPFNPLSPPLGGGRSADIVDIASLLQYTSMAVQSCFMEAAKVKELASKTL